MEVFAGPQLTPPRVSLISSAELAPIPEGDNGHWQGGFYAEIDGCDGVKTFRVCPSDADLKTITGGGTNASYKPYVLYATDSCSTFGSNVRDFYGRAQRKLIAGESAALEAILWSGYANEENLNPFLADGAGAYSTETGIVTAGTQVVTGSSTLPTEAFAILEQAMGMCSSSRGMIHLRPQLLHTLVENHVVRREGNVWLSPLDNIVVPGRGYSGDGPNGEAVGATEWMYGHPGIVQIRRGPIVRLGEDDLASQVHRGWNDREVIVERVAHVALDPSCCVYAIEVDSLGGISIS